MGLGRWLREKFGGGHATPGTVTFLDAGRGRVVRMPASDLPAGAIRVRLQGRDEPVWAMPEQFDPGPIRHAEFDEGVRGYIREIHAAFAEHRSLSFAEWEEGFRRDGDPQA